MTVKGKRKSSDGWIEFALVAAVAAVLVIAAASGCHFHALTIQTQGKPASTTQPAEDADSRPFLDLLRDNL